MIHWYSLALECVPPLSICLCTTFHLHSKPRSLLTHSNFCVPQWNRWNSGSPACHLKALSLPDHATPLFCSSEGSPVRWSPLKAPNWKWGTNPLCLRLFLWSNQDLYCFHIPSSKNSKQWLNCSIVVIPVSDLSTLVLLVLLCIILVAREFQFWCHVLRFLYKPLSCAFEATSKLEQINGIQHVWSSLWTSSQWV